MKIFLSYSSVDRDTAETLAVGLREAKHEVFFDKTDLPAGESFDDRIRKAIIRCDLFLFLVSPRAVSDGAYTRTELKLVQNKWDSPGGRVLTVMLSPVADSELPPYLRSVTYLRPEGNVVAETLNRIDEITRDARHRGRRRVYLSAVIAMSLVLIVFLFFVVSHTFFNPVARIVLVIDASKSLAGETSEKILRASARLIDISKRKDNFAIIVIRDVLRGNLLVSDFTNEPTRLVSGLVKIKFDGNKTSLYDSMYDALNQCRHANQGSSNISGSSSDCSMIVFSDGKDEGSMITTEELKQRIHELNVPIFTVRVSGRTDSSRVSGGWDSSGYSNLLYLARISDGKFYEISEIEQLADRLFGVGK